MGVFLRLEEQDKGGNIVNSVWLLNEFPTSDDDCVISGFDLGYPEARVASYTYTEANGVADVTQFHNASTVTMDGVLLGNRRWFLQDQLRGMCLPGKRLFLYVKRDEWDDERWMQLRANSYSFHSDQTAANKWPISLSFSNPSGVMHAVEQTNATFYSPDIDPPVLVTATVPTTTTTTTTAVGGYGAMEYGTGGYGQMSTVTTVITNPGTIPVTTPGVIPGVQYGENLYGIGTYGGGLAGNTLFVAGTVSVLPRITIKGMFSNLKLIFNTVGTTIYLHNLIVADGDTLVIDVPSSQILLNGLLSQSKLTYLSIDPGDGWNGWPTLEPGNNYVAMTTTSHGDNFSVTFSYRNSWV